MRHLILTLFLLFPCPLWAGIYADGYYELWADKDGVWGVSVTTPNYITAGMPAHQQRAFAVLTGPSPNYHQSVADTGYVTGDAVAYTFVSHQKLTLLGEFKFVGTNSESKCPYASADQSPKWFADSRQIGASQICIDLVEGSCKIIYAAGLPIGKSCTYNPIEDCWVPCVASIYTIYIAGRSTIPSPRGIIVKGWERNPRTGDIKCLGYVSNFNPQLCSECTDRIFVQ